jgi:glycosyltransferase 2 family protein
MAVLLVVAAVTALVIVPQVTQIGQILSSLREADWAWLAGAVLASAVTYPMAAVQLSGASRARLPAARTVAAQVAAAVPGLVAPGAIGGAGLNVRYLERSGLSRTEALTAVTLANTAAFAVHAAALVTIGATVTGIGVAAVPAPPRWALLAAVIAVAALAGVVFWSRLGRRLPGRRLAGQARELAGTLLAALRCPRQAILLLGGSAGVTAGYALALWCSLRAFGAPLSPLRAAAAYLAGAAAGAVSPTPGGLGAVDAALTGVLIRLGVTGGTAVLGVVAFRVTTYWLPVLPGAAALRALRRRGRL